MGQLQNIDHIVVLMLENRSFDCLLGKLYDKSASFDGLSGTEQNPDAHDSPILVWNSPGTAEATMRIPDPDPGELWTDINSQLFSNAAGPRPGQSPSMDGFVRKYLAQKQLNPTGTYDAKSVMHYFTSDQVPVLSTLAKQFSVCDRWFASAPCRTWPNRWFAHAATADRQENNNPRLRALQPLNSMQKALVGVAANLPSAPGTDLRAHLATLKAAGPQSPPLTAMASVHDARNFVKRQAGNYFQSR